MKQENSKDKASNNSKSEEEFQVLAAYDINHVTNDVYQHNFGFKPTQTAIEKLTPAQLDKFGANTWLLSPP
ncbi:C-5 cytosine-specific DNA methylase, partial [Physocladia obscura]